MTGKFAGVGLVNIIIIWMICCLLTVGAKTLLTQYNIPGVSSVILAV